MQRELQNALHKSRMELCQQDATPRARELTLAGKFVVMGAIDVHCPRTDAYMWEDIVIYQICDSEIEAQKIIDNNYDLWLFTLTPTLPTSIITGEVDDSPF